MDTEILEFLNGFTGGSAVLDGITTFLSSYLQYGIGAALLVAMIWPIRRYRMGAAALVSAAVARGIVKPLILLAINRPRPYVILDHIRNIVGPQTGEEYQSFPSGHAVFFFAVAMAVYMHNKRLGYWFFAGALVMGLARITGGIHWPTDVLAGAGIGMLTAWLVVRLIPALRPHP